MRTAGAQLSAQYTLKRTDLTDYTHYLDSILVPDYRAGGKGEVRMTTSVIPTQDCTWPPFLPVPLAGF